VRRARRGRAPCQSCQCPSSVGEESSQADITQTSRAGAGATSIVTTPRLSSARGDEREAGSERGREGLGVSVRADGGRWRGFALGIVEEELPPADGMPGAELPPDALVRAGVVEA